MLVQRLGLPVIHGMRLFVRRRDRGRIFIVLVIFVPFTSISKCFGSSQRTERQHPVVQGADIFRIDGQYPVEPWKRLFVTARKIMNPANTEQQHAVVGIGVHHGQPLVQRLVVLCGRLVYFSAQPGCLQIARAAALGFLKRLGRAVQLPFRDIRTGHIDRPFRVVRRQLRNPLEGFDRPARIRFEETPYAEIVPPLP